MPNQSQKPVDIGGQAVLEGVMMKGPDAIAITVRRPDKTMVVDYKKSEPLSKKHKWMGLPIIRGAVNMVNMLAMGMTTLETSAKMLGTEEEEPTKFEKWLAAKLGKSIDKVVMGVAMVLAVLLSVGLFIVLPSLAEKGILSLGASGTVATLIGGLTKVLILIAYMIFCGMVPDVRRTFQYHGAEHKTVYCHEHNLPLTPKNAQQFTTLHPRCGTAFLFLVMFISILIGAVAMFSGKITDILGKKDGLPAEMVDTGGSGMVIEPDTKEYIQDFGGCILTENGEPGITELMNTYFQAVSDCDMDTFVKLFTSQDTSEEEHYRQEFEEQKQYISGYQNVKCYTTPGLRDGEMAAYVYYEILYTGVETPAPSLVRIYAVRAEDGSWQIDDGKMSEELTQYFEELSVNEDVRLLSKQTDEAMDAAMEQDEALKERVEFMKQGASYMQEESEPAASNP